jgi:hypothetical protein
MLLSKQGGKHPKGRGYLADLAEKIDEEENTMWKVAGKAAVKRVAQR